MMMAGTITTASAKQIDRMMMAIVAGVILVVSLLLLRYGWVSLLITACSGAAVMVVPAYTIITVPH